MATQKATKKATGAVGPYVKRIMEDEDLRDRLWQTALASQKAFKRIKAEKKPSQAIFDDRKVQKEFRNAARSFGKAAHALRDAKQKRGFFRLGRLMFFGVVGGTLALILSESLRKKVLDVLFGAEEEFEYTSPMVVAEPNSGTPNGSKQTTSTTEAEPNA